MSKVALEMVEEFQCPGCMHGPDPKECPEFNLNSDVYFSCKNHYAATHMGIPAYGLTKLALGLPKGFNRTGDKVFKDKDTVYIRLYESPEKMRTYDKFNVAVWAMEREGYLFVRCYCPRINQVFVDVIKGGTISLVPDAVNVGEFYDEID